MSGTIFPQARVLTPAGDFSQPWRMFLQNMYQATSGASSTLLVTINRTINGQALSSDVVLTKADIGLANITNDAQTKAAIVPNTIPASGQVLAGNAGGTAYAAVAVSGDASMASTGALTVTSINGKAVSLAGALTTLGAFASTFTMTGVTAVTFPASGTLATLAGAEALTNKTVLESTSYVKTGSTVVASLPAAGAVGSGARHFVTDATATTFLSIVAGGGANKVPVVSDGVNWLIG